MGILYIVSAEQWAIFILVSLLWNWSDVQVYHLSRHNINASAKNMQQERIKHTGSKYITGICYLLEIIPMG